jgi:hypothetical protein
MNHQAMEFRAGHPATGHRQVDLQRGDALRPYALPALVVDDVGHRDFDDQRVEDMAVFGACFADDIGDEASTPYRLGKPCM